MKGSRRRFLQLAGLSALGLSAKPVLNAFAEEAAHGPEPFIEKGAEALTARQWALVIDTRKLESHSLIEAITEACHSVHNVPRIENRNHEIKWIWETHYKHAFPGIAARPHPLHPAQDVPAPAAAFVDLDRPPRPHLGPVHRAFRVGAVADLEKLDLRERGGRFRVGRILVHRLAELIGRPFQIVRRRLREVEVEVVIALLQGELGS